MKYYNVYIKLSCFSSSAILFMPQKLIHADTSILVYIYGLISRLKFPSKRH